MTFIAPSTASQCLVRQSSINRRHCYSFRPSRGDCRDAVETIGRGVGQWLFASQPFPHGPIR
jgi:hypothetical protein